MDNLTSQQRKRCMSRIRSKNTKPEIAIRKILTNLGYRYRLHVNKLPGKPDLVIVKHKKVIFINGCFWHQHPGCKRQVLPKTNKGYWHNKLKKNVEKQKSDIKSLKSSGWDVIIIWECEIKEKEELLIRIKEFIDGEIEKDRV